MADERVALTSPQPVAAPLRKPTTAPAEPKDSVREVVETVVFVVVLVLLLKSFVAEAFVIPTGSMAETLYGYQKQVQCPECKTTFPVNCSQEIEGNPPVRIHDCTCPNCQLAIECGNISCSSGDRVLVAKFLKDTHLRDIERWEVGVFKFPEEPQRQSTAKNYIKRILGLQRETIGILGGDLFVADSLEYGPPEGEERDMPVRRQTHKNDPRARQLLEDGSPVFKILRKPPDILLAMKRPVYDNDHQAADLKKLLPPRWAAESDKVGSPAVVTPGTEYLRKRAAADKSWDADDTKVSNGFRHPARQGELAWLRYRHILSPEKRPTVPQMEQPCEPIKDFMGYNSGNDRSGNNGANWVGDLILECEVEVEQAAGDFVIELSKGVDRFRATWQLPAGTCTLTRHPADGKPAELDQKETALKTPGTYRLRLANVDERLTLWVDNKLAFGAGVPYEPARDAGGKILRGADEQRNHANNLEPVSVGARGGAFRVHKLFVWRDTFYTDTDQRGNTIRTLYVQPGHYLCLGDNSAYSSDSRTWDHEDARPGGHGGLVPERLMLGRAMLVYWPPTRFGPIE